MFDPYDMKAQKERKPYVIFTGNMCISDSLYLLDSLP